MKLKQRTIYYQDELHDEFAGDHIKAKHIGQDYRYIRVRPLDVYNQFPIFLTASIHTGSFQN